MVTIQWPVEWRVHYGELKPYNLASCSCSVALSFSRAALLASCGWVWVGRGGDGKKITTHTRAHAQKDAVPAANAQRTGPVLMLRREQARHIAGRKALHTTYLQRVLHLEAANFSPCSLQVL